MNTIRKLLGLCMLAVLLALVSSPAFAQAITLTPILEHDHNNK